MIEKVTKPRPWFPHHDGSPAITYGDWSATNELKWAGRTLMQKFKRRVKRDWGQGCVSRSLEYDWKPVPNEASK